MTPIHVVLALTTLILILCINLFPLSQSENRSGCHDDSVEPESSSGDPDITMDDIDDHLDRRIQEAFLDSVDPGELTEDFDYWEYTNRSFAAFLDSVIIMTAMGLLEWREEGTSNYFTAVVSRSDRPSIGLSFLREGEHSHVLEIEDMQILNDSDVLQASRHNQPLHCLYDAIEMSVHGGVSYADLNHLSKDIDRKVVLDSNHLDVDLPEPEEECESIKYEVDS